MKLLVLETITFMSRGDYMKYYKDVYKYDFQIPKYKKDMGVISWDCLCGCDECSTKCYRKYKTIKRFIKDNANIQIKDYSQKCVSYTTKKKKLEYYVYILAYNEKEIVAYNIFDHYRFYHDLYKFKKKYYHKKNPEIFFNENKDIFLKEVRESLMWCYWSKYEWETCITELYPRLSYKELDRLNAERDKEKLKHPHASTIFDIRLDEVSMKIDPYYQVVMNWNIFTDYLLSNIDLIKKPKI